MMDFVWKPSVEVYVYNHFFYVLQGANWKEHLCGKEREKWEEGGGSNLKTFFELSQVIYFLKFILIF